MLAMLDPRTGRAGPRGRGFMRVVSSRDRANRGDDPRGATMTPRTYAALRRRTCGCIRVVAISPERARRLLEALPAGEYRLVTVPAAEARTTACTHNRNSVNYPRNEETE
jgi:hypothetical protein